MVMVLRPRRLRERRSLVASFAATASTRFVAGLIGLGLAAMSPLANAVDYTCSFSEPRFMLSLFPDKREAILSHEGQEDKNYEMVKDFAVNEQRTFVLGASARTRQMTLTSASAMATIDLFKSGSDGLSDAFYPYAVAYLDGDPPAPQTRSGGCTSIGTHLGIMVKRVPSFTGPLGDVIVGYWPGKSHVGFEAQVDVTIGSDHTRSDLASVVKAEAITCSIRQGKRFVPIQADRGESYAHLTPASRARAVEDDKGSGIQQSDVVALLAKTENHEDRCLVESKSGAIHSIRCPKPERGATSPYYGDWVYAKCTEGHSAWISSKGLEKSGAFKQITVNSP